MRQISSRLQRTSAREEGFSLVELVVTLTLLLVVVGAVLGVFESVQRSAAFVEARSEALDSMRLVMDSMTKEIRQATVVDPASTASKLTMNTYFLGVQKTVVYEVTGENLTRRFQGGSAQILQDNISTAGLFAYTTDAGGVVQLVALDLQVHPPRLPDTILVLNSEVRLRNGGTGGA